MRIDYFAGVRLDEDFVSTVFVVVGLVGSSHIRATKAMGKV